MLAFIFASRTLAYRTLAQHHSRSLSEFSIFLREHLDTVIKADGCAENVDDVSIATNLWEQVICSSAAVLKCIQNVKTNFFWQNATSEPRKFISSEKLIYRNE